MESFVCTSAEQESKRGSESQAGQASESLAGNHTLAGVDAGASFNNVVTSAVVLKVMVPEPAASCSTWELVRNAKSHSPPRVKQRHSEQRPAIRALTSPPGESDAPSKFENQCST